MRGSLHWSILRLLSVMAVMLVVGVACSETEPERVDTGSEESTESEDENDSGDDESVSAAESDEGEGESAADTDAEEGESASSETEEGESDGLEEAEGFAVGDTVRMGELVMTVHAVRWDDGGEFMGPDEGMRWLIADVEITNEADSATSISSLMMFDLVDEENRSRDLAIMADTQGSLDGELGGGRSMRGDLAWDVPEGQKSWELVFSPELFGFGQAIFEIGESDF